MGTSRRSSDLIGDSMYMAYHAGAALVDMEMVLYYPTVVVAPLHIRGVEILEK